MAERITRHYIVDREKLKDAHKITRHSEILVRRPTPWKTFLSGFIHPRKLGFVVMDEPQLWRLLSNDYALYFNGEDLKSNGDTVQVQKWSLPNVIKFCLEGFQYKTFLRFWEWRWR